MTFPKVSIITIVYNDKAHILETMDSVITQDYPYIEYIIIDGASHDGSKECIESYITNLAHITHKDEARFYLEATHRQKNVHFKFLSQKDSGIYDAMNKGIELASGEWCNFMNSGDRFYNTHTITELFTQFIESYGGGDSDVIYGDTHIIYDNIHSKILHAQDTSHKYHHRFIHQSAFIATPLMRRYKYDTAFKIAGDTDFFTKAYNNGAKFTYLPIIISSFTCEGISSKPSWQVFKEDCAIGYKYNRLFPIFHTFKYLFYVIPRFIIRSLIPHKFRNRARIYLSKTHS
ncbi:glycosyltransferase [Helicobacter jaachi]|uniref:Glycosyltransferase n=1 Tax=Helicobacter jaachi TaxID=1677920 RepID=A0A4U8TAL1_9HELI|nr:glycosyltransferase family 2 protein [Helicobacter jaachi]TLD96865.1 glycosyltransferase [Helicobacter jaachi]